MINSVTLYQLSKKIAEVVNSTFADFIWVVAEISEIRTASNGHCYLELVEKNPNSGSIIARAKATIWANRWWLIKDAFLQSTGQQLSAGMKILVAVQVTMHEAYGFSLNILDIDPSFTLGDIAKRRQEIIKQLTEDGIIEMNKQLQMSATPQRIAVISAQNAAGYGDLCHQLANNEWGICFYTHLFGAAMQGEKTEESIISALDKIYQHINLFDVVVIIRGGGGTADLTSFDSYDLAANVANFPLPVIVGIGHERDNTVLDIVAHTSVKTPTAAAAFLIDVVSEQLSYIIEMNDKVKNIAQMRVQQELMKVSLISERLKLFPKQIISSQLQFLDFAGKTIKMAQPDNILKRGFSITRVNGKAIKSASQIQKGMTIETETFDGKFTSGVSFI